MKIAFPCESCGYRFEVDGSLAGKKCKCKQCGHVFVIPVPRQTTQASAKPIKTFGASGSSSASTSRPAHPAPPPAFDPYYDDDPYAAADASSTPGSRNHPSAHEDEEFLPPRAPKPAAFQTVRKKKKRSDASAIEAAPFWVVKIGGGLTLASALICLFSVQTGLILVGVFYFATSLILLAMGGIGMAVVPFLESAACGLMNLFVPIYPLYYLITRWDEMKRWFLTYLVGFLLFIPGLLFAVGLPFGQMVKDAVRVEQLRAEINAAGPNDPRRAEREGELARLEAKLKGDLPESPKPFLAPTPDPFVAPAPENPSFNVPQDTTPKFPEPTVPTNGFDLPTTPAEPPRPTPSAGLPPSDPNFIPKTLSDLKASEPSRRKGALESLKGAIANPARRAEVADAVEPLLADPQSECRIDAAKALAGWGSKKNTPALIKALKDPDVEVREAVLDALAEFNDPTSAEAVSARLTDTRDKAAATLKAIGRPAEAATIKYLTHDDIWVRTEACKVLEEIGGSSESRAALADVVKRANGFGFDADAARSALQKLGTP